MVANGISAKIKTVGELFCGDTSPGFQKILKWRSYLWTIRPTILIGKNGRVFSNSGWYPEMETEMSLVPILEKYQRRIISSFEDLLQGFEYAKIP